MYPLILGFTLYSLALFFGIFQEIGYYYYYLMVLSSLLLSYFFGPGNDYYNSFQLSGL